MKRRLICVLAVSGLLISAGTSRAATGIPQAKAVSKADVARQISFGTEMAVQGNWREALFRWQRALALDPSNCRLHNNIAVAFESLGEFAKADAEYRAAVTSIEATSDIRENYDFFLKFYERYKEGALAAAPDEEKAKSPDAKSP